MPPKGRSPSVKAPAAPSPPLAGSLVFLHIRDAPGANRGGGGGKATKVKRECRQLVEQLGATLTVSEAAASLVVGMHATPAFVDACAAAGKVVVTPAYLRACAEAGRRLDVREFLVTTSVAVGAPHSEAASASAATPAVGVRGQVSSTSAYPTRSPGKASPKPVRRRMPSVPAVAASALKGLLDDEKDTTSRREVHEGAVVEAPHPPPTLERAVGESDGVEEVSSSSADTVAVTPPQSMRVIASPQTPLFTSLPDHRDGIRHAVLRSAVATTTRRRAAASLEVDAASGKKAKPPPSPVKDPFLSGSSGTPPLAEDAGSSAAVLSASSHGQRSHPQETAAQLTPSVVQSSCSVTQPLSPPAPTLPSPPQAPAVESDRSNSVSAHARVSMSPEVKPPAAKAGKGRAAAAAAAAAATVPISGLVAPPPEPPLVQMQFTDPARLRRDCEHPAKDFRIALVLRDDGVQAAFLADIVEQLGATCVSAEDMFGRHRKPTHLVVDDLYTNAEVSRSTGHEERLGLTPSILLAKALGISIVRPQWIHDAIALGGFAEVIPAAHLHPIFGCEKNETKTGASVGEGAGQTSSNEEVEVRHVSDAMAVAAAAAAAARARLAREEEETTQGILGVEATPPVPPLSQNGSKKEEVHATRDPLPSAPTTTATEVEESRPAPLARLATAPASGGGGASRTIAFLAKTTRDEVLPVGQLWERPYYKPIFAGMDFFLKIDKAVYSEPRRSGKKAARSAAAQRQREVVPTHSSPDSVPHSRLLSSDEAEAFEQATELIRVLGGTVTRNRESFHLDVILDLYGFCPPAVMAATNTEGGHCLAVQEAAAVVRSTDQLRGGLGGPPSLSPLAPPQSAVVMESMSSLSMAYQEALTRMGTYIEYQASASQRHPVGEQEQDAKEAAGRPERFPRPPVVGVPWLVHCILQRERSPVAPFLLQDDDNNDDEPQRKKAAGRTSAAARRSDKTAVLAKTDAAPPRTALTPPPPSTVGTLSEDLCLLSGHVDLLSKTIAGPAAARKHAEEQLDTQQIHAALDDAEKQMRCL